MYKRTLLLRTLSDRLFKDGAKEMTGRARGTRLRETIERMLRDGKETLIVLDFAGTGSVDFSWADEVVAKIVSRMWSDEYGEKFLVLKGLTPSQAENIGVALERKKLAVLMVGSAGWQMVGHLNNYLIQTLNRVMEKKRLTLRELSKVEGIEMNTSGTRLLNLYKKRLVIRLEGALDLQKPMSQRGRQYVYQSLLS